MSNCIKDWKRWLSLALAVILILGNLPVGVRAADGEETEKNPWSGASAVFVGDSITAGSGTEKVYYEYLEESLGFDSVTSMGVAGSCISAASDYGECNQPLIGRYQNIPSADLIVIFMGTNDYGHETPLGSVEDTEDGSFYGALNIIVPALTAKHSSSKIVFVTPLHRYGFGTSKILGTPFTFDSIPNGVGTTLGDYVEASKTVCANHDVSVIDLYTECTMDPVDPAVRSTYMPDGLHPNAAGHELIAGIMESHIRSFAPAEKVPEIETELIYGNKFASGYDQQNRASARVNRYLKAGTVITLKDPAIFQWACVKTTDESSNDNLGYFPDAAWSDKENAVVEADGWVGFTFKYRDETEVFDLTKPLSDYILVKEPQVHNVDTNRLFNTIEISRGQLDPGTDGAILESDIYGYVVNYPLKKGHTLSISDGNYVFSVRRLVGGDYSTMLKQATTADFTATEDMTVGMLIRKPDKSALTAEELASVVIYDSQYGMIGVEGFAHRFTVEAETINGGTATTRANIFLPTSYSQDGTPTRLIVMTNGYSAYLTDSVWNGNTDDNVGIIRAYLNAGYAVYVVNNTADHTAKTPDLGCPQLVSSYLKAYEYIQENFNVEQRFSIHSRSFGTFAAMRLMREVPELIKCAVLTGPRVSIKKEWPGLDKVHIANRFGFADTTGATYEADKLVGYDPYTDINGDSYALPPTYWVMCQGDATAEPLALIDKLIAHGNDVQTITHTGTTHTGVCTLNTEEMFADALEYLLAHQEAKDEEKESLREKTISILGASISTFAGTSNGAAADTTNSTIRSNVKYYPNTTIPEVTLNDTWWMQVAEDLGLRLLVNNAWSGSAILLERSGTVGAYVDRCVQLHDDTGDNAGEEPDIICIQMGFNDFSYGKDTLGDSAIDYDALITADGYAEPTTTMEATAIMLDKMVKRYPNAEIYMFNHFKRVGQSASDTALMETLNASIADVCAKFGVIVVDLYTTLTDADHIGDGRLHPNRLGMDVISEAVKTAILSNHPNEAVCSVSLELDGVAADYINQKSVIRGDAFCVNLTAPASDELQVTVTMGGEDITCDAYVNGTVSIEAVTDDVVISAKAVHRSAYYRWEFDGTDLACTEGDNSLTKNAGTTTDGIFNKTRYALEQAVVLSHDQPWSVQWKSEGTWKNTSGSGGRMFTSDDVNAHYNARYIFKSSVNGLIAMGEKTTSGSHNYGIALGDHGIDATLPHVYRLENRIADDGSNMVWLYVDGEEIGPMTGYYLGTTDKNTTSDWLSGKDFVFPYMGTDTHGFTNCSIDYIQVWEGGHTHTYENGTCTHCGAAHPNLANYKGKVISIMGDSISTFAGWIPVADGFNLEHLPRYPQDNLLTDVNETWWMQVVAALDAKLGINDSWRGATLSGGHPVTTGTTGENAAMANLTRIQNLGSNGTPDVILLYGGTNDLAHVSKVGSFDAATAPSEPDLTTKKWDNLADGFVHTLLRMKHYYPDAQIVAMLPTYTTSYYSDSKLAEANTVLAEICGHYGIPCVDLRDCGITTADLPDGIHPNAAGMDYITASVVDALLTQCTVQPGENVVYSVQHDLSHAAASLGHIKGISATLPFEETLTGENLTVTVTMGDTDITNDCYKDGKITVSSVTGDMVIIARATFSLGERLQQLPEHTCAGTNLWNVLSHDKEYYTADGWGIHASGKVYSVTIPVSSSDRLYATSFGKAGENGQSSVNGIRVTFFGEDGMLRSLSADETYTSFAKEGYLTVPEGAVAVNIPMWNNSDDNELYILNAEHTYKVSVTAPTCTEQGFTTHTCTICGDSFVDSYVDATGHTDGASVEENRVEPTCTAEGSYETVVSCAVCGAELRREKQTIPAKEHSYASSVTAPTCTDQGYTTHTCTQCGDSYVGDYVDATSEHTYENGTCTLCGAEHPNLANYAGKVISILSASTSTFDGYIPVADGFNLKHRARYPQDNLLTDVNDTWWMQLINTLDAKLGINDSWAGSRVLNTLDQNSGDLGPDAAMASMTRIQNLGANGDPDLILFFGAGNDMGGGVPLGSFDPATAPTQVDLTATKWETLADAYVAAIMRLQHTYPDAQIVAMATYAMPSYVTEAKLNKYGPVMKAICDHYGVPYVDLRGCGVTFDMLPDKIHPNAEGMDHITEAMLNKLLDDIPMESGENVVYAVKHELTNAKASLHYYKGVSHGETFTEILTGDNLTVTVTMGDEDITDRCYSDGRIRIENVSGDLVITAKAAFNADGHLQQLPEDICAGTNLWTALEPENIYYTASGWGNTAAGTSWSITFPVEPGDRIWATSLGAYPDNGSSANGVRVTWFDENGVLATLDRNTVYSEFAEYGFITAPDGAVALNVPMTDNQEHYAVYILSAGHPYEAIVTAPTCTERGFTTHTCECGDSYVDSYVDATGHSYTSVVVPPTCTEKGYTTHTCSCGDSYVSDEVAALGHVQIVNPAVDATCTATGLTEGKKCGVCGEILTAQEIVPAKGHKEVTIPAVAATCTATGLTEGKKCAVCGEILVAQTVTEKLGHKEIIDAAVAATCKTTGLTEGKHCGVCNAVLVAQEVTDRLPHSEETIPAVAATCTATGLTEGKKCADCGEILVAQTVTEKLGHKEVIDNAVAATCTASGLTEGKHCEVCGTTLAVQTVVPALGHTKVTVPAVAPTCTEAGLTDGETCSVCGIVTKEQTAVPATGHLWNGGTCGSCGKVCQHDYSAENGGCTICGDKCEHQYDAVVTKPTCTEQGFTSYRCSICGNAYNGDYVEALGHDWIAATCTAAKTCSVCGMTEGQPNGHNYETVVAAPTCTEKGYTTHTCHCGDSFTDSYINVLGHTDGASVEENRVEANCTTAGSYETVVRCAVCGAELSREKHTIPSKGHRYEDSVTAPTCTEQGYTTHTCSVCGDSFKDSYTPAMGHEFGAWEITKDASCTENGSKTRSCKREGCDYTETEVIKALGHDYKSEVTAPTCTKGGCTIHTCHCGDSYVTDEVPATGHGHSYAVTAAPTEATEGSLTGKCHCGNTVTKALPKLNPEDYTYEILREPTVEENGIVRYTWKTTEYGEFAFEVTLPKLPDPVLLGDVNDDGEITISDLMRLANHFAKDVAINEANADVNADGKVTIADLMRLANFFAGKAQLG